MADEIAINGIGHDNKSEVDEYGDESRVVELSQKVKSLELENAELARGSDEARERNHELMIEIERLKGEGEDMRGNLEGMRLEIESAEDGKRAMDSIMKRAWDLETEVVRLQHDWISATNEAEEVNRDVVELHRVIEEKEKRITGLEIEVEALRNGTAEMELRAKILEEEGLLGEYEKKVHALEAEVRKSRSELEKAKEDKRVLEDALKESEEKAKELEWKTIECQRELEVAGDAVNGGREIADAVDGKCSTGLKEHWHMLALGFAGAIAVAAVMAHVHFAKRQG